MFYRDRDNGSKRVEPRAGHAQGCARVPIAEVERGRTGMFAPRASRAVTGVLVASALGAAVLAMVRPAHAQERRLDSSWTLRVGAQTVRPNDDGTFFIPNIPAPDEFGNETGPGTRPDFVSDDPLRVIGTRVVDGKAEYVWSEPFYIRGRSRATVTIETLTFSDEPPPVPVAVRAFPEAPVLTEIGATTQIRVIGRLLDGSERDITELLLPVYRNSSGAVAGVDAAGRVEARAPGFSFITAIVEGATAVTRVAVAPGEVLTTVRGFVVHEDGSPASGMTVIAVGFGGEATTGVDGAFEFTGVPTSFGKVGFVVQDFDGGARFGSARLIEPVAGGITDAGIIVLRRICAVVADCTDSDDDCLPDEIESVFGFSPDDPDSDDDGLPDGAEDADLDGLSNCAELFLGTDPLRGDGDGDGLSDRDEVFVTGTDPDAFSSDGDFLGDGEETTAGANGVITNPFASDSDGDGWDDSTEVFVGTDPNDSEAVPEFFSVAPGAVDRRVASARVSYLDALPVGGPSTVLARLDATTVSFLNTAVLEVPFDPVVRAESPVVSYLNAALAEVGGAIPLASALVTYLNQVENGETP